MNISSILRTFRTRLFGGKAPLRKAFRRSPLLQLERLETRELLSAAPPSILGVSLFDPATGMTLNPSNTGAVDPSIAVQFNEAMDPQSVTDPTNYVVFNSSGTQIPISATSFRPFNPATNTEIIDLGRVDTTITTAMDASQTSFMVASTQNFPAMGGFVIQVDSEEMLVTTVAGLMLTVQRGVNNTVAAPHSAGTLAQADPEKVYTTLSLPATASQTSIAVASTQGLPQQTGSSFRPFLIQVESETMLVTKEAGTTLTVQRGVDNTAALAHGAGVLVAYSTPNTLAAGGYTVFLEGDHIFSAPDGSGNEAPLAPAGQVVVANAGISSANPAEPGPSNVSTINVAPNGSLDTVESNPIGPSINLQTTPLSQFSQPLLVTVADFNGDGINDVAIVNNTPDANGAVSVEIFQGLGGGQFSSTPTQTLLVPIPTSVTVGKVTTPKIVNIVSFNEDVSISRPGPDLALLDQANSEVVVFRNLTKTGGPLTFGPAGGGPNGGGPLQVPAASGQPKLNGLVADDFNNDGFVDLAVANFNADITFGKVLSGFATYNIYIWGGNGNGTFTQTPVLGPQGSPGVLVGTETAAVTASGTIVFTGVAGLAQPTDLAAGQLDGKGFDDFAVVGANGAGVGASGTPAMETLFNTTAQGAFQFNVGGSFALTAGLTPNHVALGKIHDPTAAVDDVVVTEAGASATLTLFTNSGTGTFSGGPSVPGFSVPLNDSLALAPVVARLGPADVNGNPTGNYDILVPDFSHDGFDVFHDLSAGPGTPATATPTFGVFTEQVDNGPDSLAVGGDGNSPDAFSNGGGDAGPSVAVGGGDINGDGTPDVVTVNIGVSGTISPNANLTGSSFTVVHGAGPLPFALSGGGTALASAFFDATTYVENGPTKANQAVTPTIPEPGAIAVGDLNGQGMPDYVVADAIANPTGGISGKNQIELYLGAPGPTQAIPAGITPPPTGVTLTPGITYGSTLAANINNLQTTTTIPLMTPLPFVDSASVAAGTTFVQVDSEIMQVTAIDSTGTILTVVRQQQGTVAAAHLIGAEVHVIRAYTVTDTNGHGHGPLSVTLANLSGTFWPNGEPRLDIVVADNTDNYVSILPNLGLDAAGAPVFGSPIVVPVGDGPTQVIAGLYKQGTTTLTAPIDASGTPGTQVSITVASSVGLPAVPFPIRIDSETMIVTAVSGTTLTVERGEDGTIAQSHLTGATVQFKFAQDLIVSHDSQLAPGVSTLMNSNSGAQVPRAFTTSLAADISSSTTTISVADASGLMVGDNIEVPDAADVNFEVMTVIAIDTTTAPAIVSVIRGVDGTGATAHNMGAFVQVALPTLMSGGTPLDNVTTMITVANGSRFAAGDDIQIDSELMLVTAVAPGAAGEATLTVVRGVGGTTASFHNSGALVQIVPSTILTSAINSNQTQIGVASTAGFPEPANATVLSADIGATDTSIVVASTAGLPTTTPFAIQVDAETMMVTAVAPGLAGTGVLTVRRGINGTIAAPHVTGAIVEPSFLLAAPLNANQTSVTLASTAGLPTTVPFLIQIDAEMMLVTAVTGTTLTVRRGIDNTFAASHVVGTSVAAGFLIQVDSETMLVTGVSNVADTVTTPPSTALGVVRAAAGSVPTFHNNEALVQFVGLLLFLPDVEVAAGMAATAVAAADFNNDGNLDFAFTALNPDNPASGAGSVIVMLGDGTGNFQQLGTSFPVGPDPATLAVTDVNGDGYPDIIVGSKSTNNPGEAIAVLLNTVGFGFRPAVYSAMPGGVEITSLATINLPSLPSNTKALLGQKIDSSTTSFTITSPSGSGIPDVPRTGNFRIQIDSETMLVTQVTETTSVGGVITTTLTVARGVDSAPATHNAGATITIDGLTPDLYPDLVVGTLFSTNPNQPVVDNVYTLTGAGDGTFLDPTPYEAGGPPTPATVAVTSNPFLHLINFVKGGNLVSDNLVENGSFNVPDLNGESGNLVGWQTAAVQDSHGGWNTQTLTSAGSLSPLSQVPVLPPTGQYQAMLDESDLAPSGSPTASSVDTPASYQGSNFLYQDIYIPADADSALLSFRLVIDNFASSYSPISSLDYRSIEPDQQVRVDVMNPAADLTTTLPNGPGQPGVYYVNGGTNPIYVTNQATPQRTTVTTGAITVGDLRNPDDPTNINLLAVMPSLAGQTIRLRIAVVNNQGKLVVGVDDVHLQVTYTDAPAVDPKAGPALGAPPQLRNPGFVSATNNMPTTTDATLTGQISDDGGLNNIQYIASDPQPTVVTGSFGGGSRQVFVASAAGLVVGMGLSGPGLASGTTIIDVSGLTLTLSQDTTAAETDVSLDAFGFTDAAIFKTNVLDAAGDFSLTLPNLPNGLDTIGLRVQDFAGNQHFTTVQFNYQGASTSSWSAVGPGPTNTTAEANISYSSVSGDVSAVATDPTDPSGNTYIVGSANGGLWLTTDGGASWTPLTDHLTDDNGNPINAPIGAVAYAPPRTLPDGSLSETVYAATGLGNALPYARGGVGILVSYNDGKPLTTTLAAAIDSIQTSITVASVAGLPRTGSFPIEIGTETLLVTSVTGTTLTVERGVDGTTAAPHAAGAAVSYAGFSVLDNTGTIFAGAQISAIAVANTPSPTTLSAGITSAQTTITVASATQFPSQVGFLLQVGSEIVQVTKINGKQYTVERGADGTTAAAHAQGDLVSIPDQIYVAAAANPATDPATGTAKPAALLSGPYGPGVYRSLDGGLTWTNILTTSFMTEPNSKTTLTSAGITNVASVTSLIIDPRDTHNVIIGLGNIGLVGNSVTAGVWVSSNADAVVSHPTWTPMVGGNNPNVPNNTLPSDLSNTPTTVTIGRVTVAEGFASPSSGPGADIATFYVLMGTPTATLASPLPGGTPDYGSELGLFKSSDGGLNFTKIMLKTNVGTAAVPNFEDVNLLGNDAANTGAIVVDPTDVNVIYVGGADNGATPTAPAVGLVRIDTGDMRDATYVDPLTISAANPSGSIPNDGDDIVKVLTAETEPKATVAAPLYPGGGAYTGEGVSWYDLESNSYSGAAAFLNGGSEPTPRVTASSSTVSRLPAEVQSLALDPDGRLLVATQEGVWRGVYHGVGYDVTSGGAGIGGPSPPAPAVAITTINGNLQIANLTSVASDPEVPGQYFASAYDTGTMMTSGIVNPATGFPAPTTTVGDWQTMGLDGPASGPAAYTAVDAGVVLVAPPNPTAPAGTPTTVYRDFAYTVLGDGYFPETNTQSGALNEWLPPKSAGISITDMAGYLPVLAIDPLKIFNSGVYEDLLLFGTDRIYETTTSSNLWQDKVGHPLSTLGGWVTAAAVAPSNTNVIYAGTSMGEIFVTQNNGQDNWPGGVLSAAKIPTGDASLLPHAGTTITSITVNPTNPSNAYVTFGGTGSYSHVWETTNAGSSWKPLSGSGSANQLPLNVPVYSIVSDTQNARLYLGTEVGLFVSTNSGTTWTPFGGGSVPNVPVVSLNLNPVLGSLTAATQGRGAFVIAVDAPRVVSFTPTTTQKTLGSVTVTFNKAISTFPASQVTIFGPSGPVAVTEIKDITPVGNTPHTTWRIDFNTQKTSGVYHFTVGPNVLDFLGLAMDQDQDGKDVVPDGKDSFTFTVTVKAPPGPQAPTISTIGNQHTGVGVPISVGFTVGDKQTASSALVVTATSDNPALIPSPGAVTGGSNRTLKLTPVAGQAGSANITITVQDSQGLETTETFKVTVNTVTVTKVANQQALAGTTVTIGSFTINDVGSSFGGHLATSFSVSPQTSPATTVSYDAANNALTVQPPAKFVGTFTVTVNAKDTVLGGSASTSFTVSMIAQPKPTLSVTAPAPVSHDAGTLSVPVSAKYIVAGSTLTFGAFLTNGQPNSQTAIIVTPPPPGSAPTAAGDILVSNFGNFAGSFFVTATVTTSPGNLVASQKFLVTITDNAPKFVSVPGTPALPSSITVPHTQGSATLNFAAKDGDSDTMTFSTSISAAAANAGITATVNNVSQSGMIATGQLVIQGFSSFSGTFNVTITVSDGIKANSHVVQVTVTAPKPLFNLNNITVPHGPGQTTVNLTATDPEGQQITYSASLLHAPAGVSVNVTSNPVSGNVTTGQLTISGYSGFMGKFSLTVTASNGISSTTRTVTVTITDHPPTLAPIGPVSMSEGTSGQVTLNASDPDNDPLTFSYQAAADNPLYDLQQHLQLYAAGPSSNPYFFSLYGHQEYWLKSHTNGGWYALLPSGDLFVGHFTNAAAPFGALVADVGTAVYNDISLLLDATPPQPVTVDFSLNGNVLTFTPPSNFTGEFLVTVSVSDGVLSASRSFLVTVS